MLSHQLPALFRPSLRIARLAPRRVQACRCISSTSARATEVPASEELVTAAEPEGETTEAVEWDNVDREGPSGSAPTTYKEFLEQIGSKYRKAQPSNWLSPGAPFPMNPSFRPPPPIADAQRERMYREFIWDPVNNNVRALSQRYNLSLKRVDAILRLKGLERALTKQKRLETGFLYGMEYLLGATTHSAVTRPLDSRYDVQEADILEEDEHRDAARQRYQRSYWESVPESGQEPIVPGSLEHAQAKAQLYAKKAEDFKAIPQLMPRVPDTEYMKRPQQPITVLKRLDRPSLKFVDVGAKFMDIDERIKQIAVSGRKSRHRRMITEAKRQSWKAASSSSA